MVVADLSTCHPVPKPPAREKKGNKQKNSSLTATKRMKRTIRPVPKKVKEQALEKSAFCFCGLCPVCGGLPVAADDDPHHYPHRSQGGRDIPEHIWMCKRECHGYIHDHPAEERAMFERIDAVGYPVDWDGEYK